MTRHEIQDDDAALLAELQAGSREAFGMLVRRHSERFYHVAYRYTAHREEAEDIVQAAFLKLWERPGLWDGAGGAKFTTWFYRIVANLCLDAAKRKKPLPYAEGFDPEDERERQDEEAVSSERRRALERELAALPERQRTALDLCFYEGVGNREAADAMGVSLKALESLLMRAKAQLRERLKRHL
jgi:RNA polymerase sigma-70 factor (ECF subfamily)